MYMEESKFHPFEQSMSGYTLPQQFTYPFHYTPHPLCLLAAEEVQTYLQKQTAWREELQKGKMFGVLIVQTEKGEIGYLAAFSGILAGKNQHAFFVPPVYDLQHPDGFFKKEEHQISHLNRQIDALSSDPDFLSICRNVEELRTESARELTDAKKALKKEKAKRDAWRKNQTYREKTNTSESGTSEPIRREPSASELNTNEPNTHESNTSELTAHELNAHEANTKDSNTDSMNNAFLIRESQFQKAEYKRLERRWKERLGALQTRIDTYKAAIERLKTERKMRSAALQQQLFSQFKFLNARGETKDLCAIFHQTVQKTPPAGAGECAAPKLLQYAYLQGWKPLAMAEFWWGESPKTEIRRHGQYYPACKGKCGPILAHMLVGLKVAPNPLLQTAVAEVSLDILWEDEWLVVVHKPAGMAAVPGKAVAGSLFDRLRARYPEATGPLLVHRLDMATSGVLLAAKTKSVHQHLQAQFKNRTIRKRYIALLDGDVRVPEGRIDLPLAPDPLDRPRQRVDPVAGKPALTTYRVLAYAGGRTRIALYPLTGRTHQLRVHAAHRLGLDCPIAGDELYGKKADRLYLHAEYLEFTHPVTGERVGVEKKAPF